MDKYNYKFAVACALRVRQKGFDLEQAIQERGDGVAWFAHFLCDASRLAGMGLGGSAFRDWYAGLYRCGVYLHARNYRPGLTIASDPNATITPGCQDSCAHGNPRPRLSDGARWVSVFSPEIPDALRARVLAEATDMARTGANAILERAWELRRELEEEARQRDECKREMLVAWSA